MAKAPAPPHATVPELRLKRLKRIERKAKRGGAAKRASPAKPKPAPAPAPAQSPLDTLFTQSAQLEDAVTALRVLAPDLEAASGAEDTVRGPQRGLASPPARVRVSLEAVAQCAKVLGRTPLGRAMYSRFLKDRRVAGEKGALASLRIPRSATVDEAYALIEQLLVTPGAQAVAQDLWAKYHR